MMKIVVSPRHPELYDFVRMLPERFEQEGEMLYDGRNRVKLFMYAGRQLVVKRYKRPHLIQRIVYKWFRPSKAERAYRFAFSLEKMGIDTPEPLAYVEVGGCLLFGDSYFVSARCADPDLMGALYKPAEFPRPLAVAWADRLAEFHEKGFLHGDLNLANILYRTDPQTGACRFTVIDINRSHFRPHPSPDECMDNLVRLTHRVDLLCFLVAAYARRRGWDEEQTVNGVLVRLRAFEQRCERKQKLKQKMKRS